MWIRIRINIKIEIRCRSGSASLPVEHGFFLTSRKFVTSSCWYSFCCIRWKMLQCISQPGVLPVSSSLRLLPLYILALLKSSAFTPRYRYSGIFYIAYKLLVRYMLVGTGVRSLVLDFFLPLSD